MTLQDVIRRLEARGYDTQLTILTVPRSWGGGLYYQLRWSKPDSDRERWVEGCSDTDIATQAGAWADRIGLPV